MRSRHPAWRVVALAVAFAAGCSGPEDSDDATPIVSAIEPACGDASTATPVVVRGSLPVHAVVSVSDPDRSEMNTAYRAWVGAMELTAVRWASAGELRAVVPAGIAPGTYGVTVEGPSGKRGTRDAAFEVRPGTCPVQTAALVIVDPVAAPATTVVGQEVTVTATVRNDGLAAASAVAASIVSAPPGLTLVQGPAGPQDIPSGQARTFTWTYGTFAPGGGVFVVDATGTAGDTGQPVAAQRKSTNEILVNPAIFLTAETVVTDTVTVGQLIAVALTATNHSTSAAVVTPGIVVTGPVTAGRAPTPQTIPGGSSRIFQWTFTTTGPGTASFTASVSATAPGTGELVTIPTAQADVIVQSVPALNATLEILPPFELGDITVRMRVSNSGGPTAATVENVVPDVPKVEAASTAQVTLKSGPTGSPAVVAPGQPDVEFTWVYTATARGSFVLTSAARGTDANTSSPIASATVSSNQAAIGRFTVGGSIAGYDGQDLVLQNGAETLPIPRGARSYVFPTAIASGGTYNVTVATHPNDPVETCTVSNGSGTIGAADVTDANVTCSKKTFTIGGSVSGLVGSGLVLHNGSDDLLVTANGGFTFPTAVASGGTYDVRVAVEPAGPSQTCRIANGSGKVGGANVTSVNVTCSTNTYAVGGTVSGLVDGGTLVLVNNGGDNTTITTNGSYTFATPVPSGSGYAVTVLSEPASQTCIVSNGSGAVGASPVTNVNVTCSTKTYAVGGTVSGLVDGGTLVLVNNGGDNKTITTNGSYTFATPVSSGSGYAVSVLTKPTSQNCDVSNASGTVGTSPVTNVDVTCSTKLFTVSVAVSGLTASGLVLQNNGGDDLRVDADGTYAFPTPVPSGIPYSVTVLTAPTSGQTCTPGGSGTVGDADVTVPVSCAL